MRLASSGLVWWTYAWLMWTLTCGTWGLFPGATPDDGDYRHLYPKLSLALHLENHAHALPYLLGFLENADYPKNRIALDVFVGRHIDATLEKTRRWINEVRSLFATAELTTDSANWREDALHRARVRSSQFVFIIKGDHLFWDVRSLQNLLTSKAVVVTPLMFGPFGGVPNAFVSDVFNERSVLQTVEVPFVAEPLLVDLSKTDSTYLTFSHENLPFFSSELSTEPLDVFLISAERMNIPMFVDNRAFYGYFFNSSLYTLDLRRILMHNFVADLISDYGVPPLVPSSIIAPVFPRPSLFGVDKIYLINLRRRLDRRQKMEKIMKLMGMKYSLLEASDGQHLEEEKLASGIVQLKDYEDPYYKRPMKAGEVGCFLSHYRIWKEMVDKSLKRCIVFEDDLRFVVNSTVRLAELIEDLDRTAIDWDLVYLGRKQLSTADENWVTGHRHLSTVGYSYWTLGYLLSLRGASKLLAAKPLERLVPVDEYLPIMFDRHPNTTWKEAFSHRDLVAYSVYPTVVVPERYTNEAGYVSDTEDSNLIQTSAPQPPLVTPNVLIKNEL